MNQESSSFARCVRHPSQFFTGFCSSCLAERLSSVDSVERNPKPSLIPRQKQGECSLPVPEFQYKACEVRVRNSLLSLFHLDDINATEKQGQMENDRVGLKFSSETRVTESRNDLKSSLAGQHFNLETRVSSSVHAVNDVSADGCARKTLGSVEDGSSKEKGVPFWLGSMFAKKVMKWRIRSAFKNNSMQEKSWSGGFGEKQAAATGDFRRPSCDQKVSCESNKALWEDPRHSWDGVIMGKVFTPSFTGINEMVEKTSEVDWRNSLMTHRRRMSLPEEAMLAEPRPSAGDKDTSRISTTYMAEETLVSAESSLREPIGNENYEEPRQDITVLNIRRRSHGWSKVWNRSITSPFREFIQRRENVLERSLSECWGERHREKNLETMETNARVHFHGSSISTAKKQQILNRSNNVGDGDLQRYRPECPKRKELQLGRSQSVHYPSPGNPDSGLLRFYLTPLRSSKRATSRRRMKTSRSFARSILGL